MDGFLRLGAGMSIGTTEKQTKRKASTEKSDIPARKTKQMTLTNNATLRTSDDEAQVRRKRIPSKLLIYCHKIAYNFLDSKMTGKMDAALMRDMCEELEYLVKHGKTCEEREEQRFLTTLGPDYVENLIENERKAEESAEDLSASDDDEQDQDESLDKNQNSDVPDSDDENFIAPEGEASEHESLSDASTEQRFLKLQKKYAKTNDEASITNDVSSEDQQDPQEDSELDAVGKDITEVD